MALAFAAATILGSVLLTFLLTKGIKKRTAGEGAGQAQQQPPSLGMTAAILVCVVIGVAAGRLVPAFQAMLPHVDSIVMIGVYAIVFVAGIDFGRSRSVFSALKQNGMEPVPCSAGYCGRLHPFRRSGRPPDGAAALGRGCGGQRFRMVQLLRRGALHGRHSAGSRRIFEQHPAGNTCSGLHASCGAQIGALCGSRSGRRNNHGHHIARRRPLSGRASTASWPLSRARCSLSVCRWP